MKQLTYRAVGLASTAVEGRRVFGLAAPFNEVVTISEHGSTFRERIAPGAFSRSIAERGHKIKVLAQHDHTQPIGRASMLEERDDGLFIEATISDTTTGDDTLALIRDGVLDSFSIGFRPIRERNDDGIRTLTEVALHEISIVTFPAYPGASIAGVRSYVPGPRIDRSDALRRLAALETHQ